ncbi:hypothetical protein FISHEDRAFT_75037 [Fistulina hepatica ATCC 64428]|uniref:Uncharacterized protein n=1 Tax=Fistulina hepatica ATCC 64428 TaxID=1128425 RepID=A0A0D7AAN4_9AGAR|nr:hypothetical protein FISHEDRAFT_75037 [Fistulina hepatica ATCC 64428]
MKDILEDSPYLLWCCFGAGKPQLEISVREFAVAVLTRELHSSITCTVTYVGNYDTSGVDVAIPLEGDLAVSEINKPEESDNHSDSKSEDLEGGPTLANATSIILTRNSDIDAVISSAKVIEDRFNHRYHYPYVFLNDEPLHHDFIYY